MTYMAEVRRRMLDQIEQARDCRSDEQKLADAVARHLSNIGLHSSLAAEPALNIEALEQARADAIRAFDDSQAELFRLVEDICLIDPRKLGKALVHAIP